MAFCFKCGAQVSEGAAFCDSCGVRLPAYAYAEDPAPRRSAPTYPASPTPRRTAPSTPASAAPRRTAPTYPASAAPRRTAPSTPASPSPRRAAPTKPAAAAPRKRKTGLLIAFVVFDLALITLCVLLLTGVLGGDKAPSGPVGTWVLDNPCGKEDEIGTLALESDGAGYFTFLDSIGNGKQLLLYFPLRWTEDRIDLIIVEDSEVYSCSYTLDGNSMTIVFPWETLTYHRAQNDRYFETAVLEPGSYRLVAAYESDVDVTAEYLADEYNSDFSIIVYEDGTAHIPMESFTWDRHFLYDDGRPIFCYLENGCLTLSYNDTREVYQRYG